MQKKMFKVLTMTERDGVTHWTRLGVGFSNKDDSINMYLDGLPANGKLQLREWDEEDDRERRSPKHGPGPLPVAMVTKPLDSVPF